LLEEGPLEYTKSTQQGPLTRVYFVLCAYIQANAAMMNCKKDKGVEYYGNDIVSAKGQVGIGVLSYDDCCDKCNKVS
jgi:hypothetical protein